MQFVNPEAYNDPTMKELLDKFNKEIEDKKIIEYEKAIVEYEKSLSNIYFSEEQIEQWMTRKSYFPGTRNTFIRGSIIHRAILQHVKKYFNIELQICNYTHNTKKGQYKWIMLQHHEAISLKMKYFTVCGDCNKNKYLFIVHSNDEDIVNIIKCPICNKNSHIKYLCTNCNKKNC